MPPTALKAPRGERRGLLILTVGPVMYFYGVIPPARWSRFYQLTAPGVPPLSSRARHFEGREGPEAMTRTEDNQAARRRGEWARERGSRAFDRAVHARRRFDAPQADRSNTKAARHGPSATYAYLTQSHD